MANENNFEQLHPLYEEYSDSYKRNADLYDGGQAIEKAGNGGANPYLHRHRFEKDEEYEIRRDRASYKNYAAPTVDLFAASIMDGAKREGIEDIDSLEPLLRDCNREGKASELFFGQVCTRAAAEGARFVLVDMTTSEEAANTLAEAKSQGLMPYFVDVPALSMIAWDYAPDGSLDYVVIRDERQESSGPFTEFETVKVLTVWTKVGWQRLEARDKGSFEVVADGEHHLGEVPIVPFLYEETSPMTGKSVIDDVASLILRIFNNSSEQDKQLFDTAFPLLAAFGLKDEEEHGKLMRSTSLLWAFSDPTARLEFVEPSGQSFAARRQQILDDIESLREISLRQTRKQTAQAETYDSKRLDTVQIKSQLAQFAVNASACERKCWELAAKWLNLGDTALDNVVIAYNEEFDPEATQNELFKRYMELRSLSEPGISLESIYEILGLDAQEEKAKLENEQRSGTDGTGPTNLGQSLADALARGQGNRSEGR